MSATTMVTVGVSAASGLRRSTVVAEPISWQDLKIEPLASGGTLPASLHRNGSPIPNQQNLLRGKTTICGASGEVKNDADGLLTVWLVINDAALENTQESKLALLKVESENDRRLHNRSKSYRNYNPEEPDSWTPLDHCKYVQSCKDYLSLIISTVVALTGLIKTNSPISLAHTFGIKA